MQIAAKLYLDAEPETRVAERRVVERTTTVRDEKGVPHPAMAANLSTSGCLLETTLALDIGQSIRIGLPGVGAIPAHVVRRHEGGYGCRFEAPLSDADVEQAFSESTVVHHPAYAANDGEEIEVARWPGPVRIGILLALGAGAWALLLKLVL